MNILLAVDGSPYTQKMLAYLTSHPEILGAAHSYSAITVQPQLPARARAALGKDVVDEYYAEESTKVLDPVCSYLAEHGVQATRPVMGSVSTQVLAGSQVPVLLIR
jgi:hypothetical protein